MIEVNIDVQWTIHDQNTCNNNNNNISANSLVQYYKTWILCFSGTFYLPIIR